MTLLDLVVVVAVLALLFWLLRFFDHRPAPAPAPPVPATAPPA
jgi:hypothetical protein